MAYFHCPESGRHGCFIQCRIVAAVLLHITCVITHDLSNKELIPAFPLHIDLPEAEATPNESKYFKG